MPDAPPPVYRSTSRGRDAFQSSGRGGIGNIRQASQEPPRADPDNASPARGREPTVNPERVLYTGRGGAGNIRSASRAQDDPTASSQATAADYERGVILNSEEAAKTAHSSGRGGLGNIRSPSRSQSRGPRTPPVRSTGRGGAGNLVYAPSEQADALAAEELERQRLAHGADGIHSTGRGGLANITSLPTPPPDYAPPQTAPLAESTGRGGAGNIVRSRSASRDPERRDTSRGRSASKDRHALAHLWSKLTQERDERADGADGRQSAPPAPIVEAHEDGENARTAVDA
ncbi:hypothetical protein OBBRIDRAFT_737742 [Obba rivulosa]|uniref:Uncharacterized protein n=1 Tax=Obba rivulosa TaxID=1052685 RepID=A0A8E2DH35_9APHY|nr:hypothetical protein OBBRIDRAFT_737742 [Obba rivulosa]